jgi:hypothetical protein
VIISDSWNVGDGHVTCGQETFKVLEDWKQKTGREYVVGVCWFGARPGPGIVVGALSCFA